MKKTGLLIIFMFSSAIAVLSGQNIDMDKVNAEEEFRWGVVAFHSGYYNKAILSFEKSLSLKPENPLTRTWLARAFYQSGLTDAALYEWNSLIDAGLASSALKKFYETVSFRYGLGSEMREEEPWIPLLKLNGFVDDFAVFHRPTAVVSAENGSGDFYIVSFFSNEIVQMNPNGTERNRFRGGFDGFDHPFDMIAESDGSFIVSEFERDVVTLCNKNGYRKLPMGGNGIHNGELKGPQFLAPSAGEYFYISDYGNRRVCKFDMEGNFILNLGEFSPEFEGFKGPSGIAVCNGFVYVADALRKKIYVFDENGNFINILIEEDLHGPEGLEFRDNDNLFIADTDRILKFNLADETLIKITDYDGDAKRITDICLDDNGNLIASDINDNSITILSEVSSIYSGLFVRINRIESNRYPNIRIDLTIEDIYGNPVVGMDYTNFIIMEKNSRITDFNFEYSGYRNESASLAILVDGRPVTIDRSDDMNEGIKQVLQFTKSGDNVKLLMTGEQPALLAESAKDTIKTLPIIRNKADDNWSPDAAIRLSASELLSYRSRKAVIFFTTGKDINPEEFNQYDLIELGNYMKNNGIRFYTVYLTQNAGNHNLEYLSSVTGGRSVYLYQTEGLYTVIQDIRTEKSGNYTLSYKSKAQTDFGRAYIPLSVEIIYIKKSGRDEMGYFAPGDF